MTLSKCTFAATALVAAGNAAAETHRFEPAHYYNTFSFAHKPVLTIKPGDKVVTRTIDARGFNSSTQQVGEKPNPQTGPSASRGPSQVTSWWSTSTRSSPAARQPGRAARSLNMWPTRHFCASKGEGADNRDLGD